MIWWADKDERRDRWQRWFAWHPVTIGDYRVWLEVVERRRVFVAEPPPFGKFIWEFRWLDNITPEERKKALEDWNFGRDC